MTTMQAPTLETVGFGRRPRRCIGMIYARMTRDEAVKSLGRIEAYAEMPDTVAQLFDDGREWEALRLWRDMLKVPHRDRESSRERRAEREKKDEDRQADKKQELENFRVRTKSLSEVVDMACNLWGLPRELMILNTRGLYSKIRLVISKYCYDTLKVSFPEIAFVLRGSPSSHATICEYIHRWEESKDTKAVLQYGGEFRAATLTELYKELERAAQ